jgi:uncharacterized protein (TIGR02246 family)
MVQRQFDELRAQFMSAFNSTDPAAVAALYTEDGKILPPNMPPVVGREAIAEFWKGAKDMGMGDLRLDATELLDSGELAYEMGTYTLAVNPPGGEAMTDVGKYVVVLRLQDDNSWKIAVDMFSSDAPPPGN